jgi:hypothetical protein
MDELSEVETFQRTSELNYNHLSSCVFAGRSYGGRVRQPGQRLIPQLVGVCELRQG